MTGLEMLALVILIALLSAKELIRAYYAGKPGKKHMRIMNIIISPFLIAFCVMLIRTVVSAAGG